MVATKGHKPASAKGEQIATA